MTAMRSSGFWRLVARAPAKLVMRAMPATAFIAIVGAATINAAAKGDANPSKM